jgi:hypothetical protein
MFSDTFKTNTKTNTKKFKFMKNKKTFNHPWHSARRIATLLFILVLTATWNHTSAQTINVRGHITDSRGEPLPGVNILIKGTTTGTITNVDGNYEIKVPNPPRRPVSL